MEFTRRSLLAGGSAGALALALAGRAGSALARTDQHNRLLALFEASDEASLKLNPISALARGDLRYADRFGDYLKPAYLRQSRANIETDLRRLRAIDRASLSVQDRISYDVFEYTQLQARKGLQPPLVDFGRLMPIDHFNGAHTFFPQFQSGQSIAPYRTVRDYENGMKRVDGYVAFLRDAEASMREGIARGIVLPKLVAGNVISQLDGLLALSAEQDPFLMPVNAFGADVPAAERARLRTAYEAMVARQIRPAHQRLRDFMADTYLPACRDTVGLSALPGGRDYYAFLVEQQTTTSLTPEAIHQLGLDLVARIKADMIANMKRTGFTGDLPAFFAFLRTDPRFKFESKAALLAGYNAIRAKVTPVLPKFFRTVPKTPFEIQPVPEFQERNQAAAYYQPGTPDGSRPGVFYVNTYDLPSRTSPGMETLFLHEAEPGHHFQISLAQEATDLPKFQRFGGNVAYAEGWALYTESLGSEMGLFTDPYQLHGHYDDAMLRAMRLVVDTGLHAKGWTREQGIQFFLDNSSQSETDSTAEIERYIAMPGQALGYMIGKLKLIELRERAQAALGARYDIRDYHDQVLMSGALPLAILERKIDGWIAASRA